MTSSRTLLPALLALLSLPALAAAEPLHRSREPEPRTRGCQNAAAAFHANGDVVMVEYHGQWKRHSASNYSQNGGFDGIGCEVERIVRLSPDGIALWELQPTYDREELGLARQDKVIALLALPDGSTVITSVGHGDVSPRAAGAASIVGITRIDADGGLLWRIENARSPRFAYATPHLGEQGELFLDLLATNYGYAGGELQLPGGERWRLRKHENKRLIVRLDPATGALLWEQSGFSLVSADAGELLTIAPQLRRRDNATRFRIARLSYDGAKLGTGRTEWLSRQGWATAARFDDTLAITTDYEELRADGRKVARRTSKLHLFSLSGAKLASHDLSDNARIARPKAGAPLRIVSPTSCLRGLNPDVSCATDGIEVFTLPNKTARGRFSRLALASRLPGSAVENRQLAAVSTDTGLWLQAVTVDRQGGGRGVAILHSAASRRSAALGGGRYVWRPQPPATTRSPGVFDGL